MTTAVHEPDSSPIPQRSFGDWVTLAFGTGLFIGTIPPKTATIATTLGIPLAIALYSAVGWYGYVPILVVLWIAGFWICDRSAILIGKHDPREIVYDEYTTLPMIYFLTPNFGWKIIVAGFLLHRFFDILKPLGIRRLERLPGGRGIMSDDILAGIYGWLCMQLLLYFQILGAS